MSLRARWLLVFLCAALPGCHSTAPTDCAVLPAAAAVADPAADFKRQFMHPTGPFETTKDLSRTVNGVTEFRVTMPSPVDTGMPVNDTIVGYYYQPAKDGDAAVIVLPIANSPNLALERAVGVYLAGSGFKTFVMTLPLQHERGRARADGAGPQPRNLIRKVRDEADLAVLCAFSRQAVADVRRVRQWLIGREGVEARRLGLIGMSLGSLVASVAYSIDSDFPCAVLALSGGDLGAVVWQGSRETAAIKQALEARGQTLETVREALRGVDPLTFATPARRDGLLMINASHDQVFPAACSRKLYEAYGQPAWVVLPGDHYTVSLFLPTVLERSVEHFRHRLR